MLQPKPITWRFADGRLVPRLVSKRRMAARRFRRILQHRIWDHRGVLVPRFAALDFAGQNFALTAFGIAFMITRFVGSGYADRFGGRRVLLTAFLIEAAGLAGLFLARVEWLAFASTALAGAGLSLLIPSVTSIVTEAADPRERTAALGAVTSAWDLGVAVGGPLGGLVAGASNAGPFALGAVAALIAIVPLAINPTRERALVPPKEA
jgi:MFS family permease